MKRGSYQKVQQKNRPILEKIRQLKCFHPYRGYQRVRGYIFNKTIIVLNRVYRLMSEENLLAKKKDILNPYANITIKSLNRSDLSNGGESI